MGIGVGLALDAGVRELGWSLFGDPASWEAEANVIQAHAREAELSPEREAIPTRPSGPRRELTPRPEPEVPPRSRAATEVERTVLDRRSARMHREREAISEPEIGLER